MAVARTRSAVAWPTSTLETITLIDTPGLASLNDENSRRTREFLEFDENKPSDADAVIYLMRHAHRSDVAFLDAFMDRSVTAASPVNAVAVLSRADEIGAGRLDAMVSSAKIAAELGFVPQHTIEEAVRDLVAAFRAGKLPDSMSAPRYFNIKMMQTINLQ